MSGSRSAIADEEMCRPRPVTALTSPIAPIGARDQGVDQRRLADPEWPTKTLRWPCRAARAADPDRCPGRSPRTGTPSGSYCAMSSSGAARSALVRHSSGWMPASYPATSRCGRSFRSVAADPQAR